MALNFLLSKTMAAIWLTTIILTQGILFSSSFQLKPKSNITSKLSRDPQTLSLASGDFGFILREKPKAVLEPTSANDIVDLIKLSNSLPTPFTIATRGQGHSVNGQALTNSNGIVVNMTRLGVFGSGSRIVISNDHKYVDVGGEQIWIDVLNATLDKGLTPLAFTDYLYLSVGGTLSNAGVSGQSFISGPQISNVLELDVVTGTGYLVTCSPKYNSELFYAVLGGLGQFGVIVRARIPLGPAPTRARWIRLLYSNFTAFSEDEEHLISLYGKNDPNAPNYVEGALILDHPPVDLSFYPTSYQPKIRSLLTKHGIIYGLDVIKYYDNSSQSQVDQQVAAFLKGLKYDLMFKFDATYKGFLNRVFDVTVKADAQGLVRIPHPWLNFFVPRSRIFDFNEGVFRNIVLRRNITTGTSTLTIFPTYRSKWDDRLSAVTPDEDIFYAVFLLFSVDEAKEHPLKEFQDQNQEILKFLKDAGIKYKEYLPKHQTQQEWIEHYGPKWPIIQDRKAKFDPKKILSPGQKIFNN